MKKLLATLTMVLAFAPVVAFAADPVSPSDVGSNACKINPAAIGCGGKKLLGAGSAFGAAINAVIFVAAAVSVLMIVIGGLRYTLSGGDSAGIRSAKDTIIYAVVGLVICITAFGIVNFVIGRF